MSWSQPSSGPSGGGALRGDPLTPALSVVSLQYHTVPPEKLVAKTFAGLVSAGIPSSALGRIDGALAVTVTGCIVLNSAARDSLPSQLGGSDSPFEGSPATHDLADKSVRSSPSSRSGASSPFGTPTRPRSASPSPGAALSPSTADKARAHEALAAGYMASVRVRDDLLAAQAAAARAQLELTGARLRSGARQRGEAPRASAGTADGAEESDEAPRLLAEAEAGVAAAASALASAASAAAVAARHVVDLESVVSALSLASPAPSRTPSGSSIRGMDMAREQQHLLASAQSAGIASDAIAILSAYPVRFPLIYRALLMSCGGSAPAVLSDFSLLALVPAVQAARQQEWGLDQLRAAVTRTATIASDAGTAAVHAFADHTFDFNGAQAIKHGHVAVELSPLDMCLGVLPLTQLAVHLWLQYHSYTPVDSTVLLELARSVTFVVNGRLDPSMGLTRFLPAWAQTLGAEAEFPHIDVHCLLMQALGRDALAPGGGHVTAPVRGAPMTWTTFAFDRTAAWEAACTARHVHTLEELEKFVEQLRAFGLACCKMYRAAGNIRSPTAGGSGSSVLRAAAVASPPGDPAPPPPPPTGAPAPVPPAGAVRAAPGPHRFRRGPRAPKTARPARAMPPPPARPPLATLQIPVQVIPTRDAWQLNHDGMSFKLDAEGQRIPKKQVLATDPLTGAVLLDAEGYARVKNRNHGRQQQAKSAAQSSISPSAHDALDIIAGAGEGPELEAASDGDADDGADSRPKAYWAEGPCDECAGPTRGCDVLCTTCTVYNPATHALPGTHYCRHCGVLYRVECRFAHQLLCHSRPGTTHSEPFDIGNRDHRFALLAMVSRLTHSKINVALRAHNKQHPSKRLRDIALREAIGGWQRIAHPNSPVAAELAIMAQGYPLPSSTPQCRCPRSTRPGYGAHAAPTSWPPRPRCRHLSAWPCTPSPMSPQRLRRRERLWRGS